MKPDFDDDFGRDGAFALSPDAMIWLVCAMVVSTLLLGIGLVTILTVPALIADAARHILAAVITSFMFAPLLRSVCPGACACGTGAGAPG